jgi:hypothetical protein
MFTVEKCRRMMETISDLQKLVIDQDEKQMNVFFIDCLKKTWMCKCLSEQ